jgi:hypothetical protein
MAGQSKERVPGSLGFAEMLRDVLVASINRGQFPFALLGLVVLVSILKMPAADVSTLVFRLVESITGGPAMGYVLAALMLIGWSWHVSYLRRAIGISRGIAGVSRSEKVMKVDSEKVRR